MRTHSPNPDRGTAFLVAPVTLASVLLAGPTISGLTASEPNLKARLTAGQQAFRVTDQVAQRTYADLAACGFSGRTHDANGNAVGSFSFTSDPLSAIVVVDGPGDDGLADERDDGTLVWQWSPGDEHASLTGTGMPELVRVAIRSVETTGDDAQFTIDVEGAVGRARSRLQLQGVSEPLADFALFSDGTWSELAPNRDAFILGKVHANGDLHLRSAGGTLSIDAPSVTATGRILSSVDAFGRPVPAGGLVQLRTAAGSFAAMSATENDGHFDSRHTDWANRAPVSGAPGALDRWGSVVRDGSIGATRWDSPPRTALEVEGWYDRHAGLRLRADDVQLDALGNDISATIGGSVRTVRFWNPALGEFVAVQELDLTRLAANGDVPANGVIHADVPIRIVRAAQLPSDLTIVCSASIYTRGNFNRVNPHAALLVSGGRIWHLSNAWSDEDALAQGPTAIRQASSGETVIRAACVDGVPAIGTAHYADLDGDGIRDDPTAGDAVANAAALLETWGADATLHVIGPAAHLQCADMADNPYNAGKHPGEISWIRWSAYSAPAVEHDLETGFGADRTAPLPVRVGRVLSRQEIGS